MTRFKQIWHARYGRNHYRDSITAEDLALELLNPTVFRDRQGALEDLEDQIEKQAKVIQALFLILTIEQQLTIANSVSTTG